jgi:HEAT repeat protein
VSGDEIEKQIQALVSPRGHEADRREHDRALAFLLTHADEAHPRLLSMLNPSGYVPVAAVNALPHFGRAESVPALEKLMREGAELISMSAGQALGRHPLPEAREALLRGLEDNREATRVAAIDGLMTRGDKSVCNELQAFLDDPSYEVRYHTVKAAAGLRCLTAEKLRQIADNDSEKDIRDLAADLMSGRS